MSLAKGGEKAIYLDFIVLGQLMPVANVDPSVNPDTYVLKENEVIMYCPVYKRIIWWPN